MVDSDLPFLELGDVIDEVKEVGADTFAGEEIDAEIVRGAAVLVGSDIYVVC